MRSVTGRWAGAVRNGSRALELVVSDVGGDPGQILAAEAGVGAAVAAGRLDSVASNSVFDTLEVRCAAQDMPSPEFGGP